MKVGDRVIYRAPRPNGAWRRGTIKAIIPGGGGSMAMVTDDSAKPRYDGEPQATWLIPVEELKPYSGK